MGLLTNVFYLISTALLIPCMLGLLWCLMRVLLLAGQTLREHGLRRRQHGAIVEFLRCLESGEVNAELLPRAGCLGILLARLCQAMEDPAMTRRLVREAELLWKTDLERFRLLTRNGPALGLMGTLVPLGPALVGLAAGDLATLSANLIVAFATTVVGLLVAIISSSVSSVKRRWYQGDAILLNFAVDRLAHRSADQLPQALSGQPADGKTRSTASAIPN
jgi:biopolymer transport protein ExbB/TolQ